MTMLTIDQIDHYKNKGYVSSVSALTSSEAKEIREEIEKIEKFGQELWTGLIVIMFI